jgi:hypothetical protein
LRSQNVPNHSTAPQALSNGAPRAAVGWADFKARIEKDDEEMVAKAKEGLEKLGGDKFRPEIREMYRDKEGRKEVTVREKSGGREVIKGEDERVWEEGSDGGVKL